ISATGRSSSYLIFVFVLVARPDSDANAIAYRLSLPPARHDELQNFRVLIITSHPSIPTAANVGAALERVAAGLEKRLVRTARSSPLLPDLAEATRLYVRLLSSIFGAYLPLEQYQRVADGAQSLPTSDERLAGCRARGA